MLMLLSRMKTINHLHTLCQTHHPLHVKLKLVQVAFLAGVLAYGGTNLNILLMTSYGVQIFTSVARGALQMVMIPVSPDFQENCLKQQQLTKKQVH